MNIKRRVWSLIGLIFISITSNAHQLIAGVAGGFKPAMEPLVQAFEKETGHHVLTAYASVGVLYAEIKQGAPFDLFISADIAAPESLERQKIGVSGTRISYAASQLVLWSANRDRINGSLSVLQSNSFTHLALPNPKVGVHGKAAIEVLDKLGLTQQLRPKFVEGKNVLQTFQFIESGAAELGFISLSLIYREGQAIPGSYRIIPASLHPPLEQQAVRLRDSKAPKVAQSFLDFMLSPAAQAIIRHYGYLPVNLSKQFSP